MNVGICFCGLQELFVKAMDMVGSEFKDRILYLVRHWLPAREVVQSAFQERHKVGRLLGRE